MNGRRFRRLICRWEPISLIVDDDSLEPDVALLELWDELTSETLDDLEGDEASSSDSETSSLASESSTDEDDSSEYYETAPESQPNTGDDDDNDDSPPCAGACAITVDYSDDDSDLSDLEGQV